MKIKQGDNVMVIAGKHRGEKAKVIKVIAGSGRVVLEGVAKIKRHQRGKGRNEKGSVVERESSIHHSNVMAIDPTSGTRSRVGRRREGEKSIRYAKKSGKAL